MPAHCTVIIPVKNGMPDLARVLPKVLAQKTPWPFDVLAVDSGSRDGSVALLKASPDVRLVEIPSQDFGHGKTRNLAISMTDAPFVAMLTQDAEPVDESWLATLVASVEADPTIAGAFGRHVAAAEASIFVSQDLEAHFAAFGRFPAVVDRTLDVSLFPNETARQQFLHFFSDNNACLRRSVWEQIPYPEVDFAEDQLWAQAVIAAGWKRAYSAAAAVRHSHEFGAIETLRRAFDESMAFERHFGYRLSASLVHALLSAGRRSLGDVRLWAKSAGKMCNAMPLLWRIVANVSLVAGHWLGAKSRRLPPWLVRSLSRDRRLFSGAGKEGSAP